MTRVIGITGGLASGKSTATHYLRTHGHPVICADELSQTALTPGQIPFTETVSLFGEVILNEFGEINRQVLAALVFANQDHRRQLEGIIHPYVVHHIKEFINDARTKMLPVIFVDVPLLFETNMDRLCDETICIFSSEDLQISRYQARTGEDATKAKARIQAQMPLSAKAKRATHTIQNNDNIDVLHKNIANLLTQLGLHSER